MGKGELDRSRVNGRTAKLLVLLFWVLWFSGAFGNEGGFLREFGILP